MTETTQPVEVRQVFVPANVTLESAKLIALLSDGQPGDILTDDEMTRVCGKNTRVHGNGYSYLQTAIRYVRRNKELSWFRIRKANQIKCGEAIELLDRSDSDIRSIRRKSKKTMQNVSIARSGDLDNDGIKRANILAAQAGALAMVGSIKTRNGLSRIAAPKIDQKKLLAAF